jgi:hypothetical protein
MLERIRRRKFGWTNESEETETCAKINGEKMGPIEVMDMGIWTRTIGRM